MRVFSYYRPISQGHFWDDDEKDNIVIAQLITPENGPYDDKVSAEDWNLLLDASDDEDD